jgi:predicted ribosome quality control (RQC) complex YloA/Tae2 family protein
MVEVGIRKPSKMKQKPHILKYTLKDGSVVMVGKNNIQNNYLTHTLANKNDYFFHVKNSPGSHVILKGNLTDENIKIAGAIASYYSKQNTGINVCVDYTQVKWLKKVKGTKGSFVTYTNEKNVFSNPSLDYINNNTITDK